MSRRIVIIDGHPDPASDRFGHALAAAYAEGAAGGGHRIRTIALARMQFPVLRSRREWEETEPPDVIQQAQESLAWAEHLVIFYPLWLGSMPALLKAFLEQTFRPGFAIAKTESGSGWKKQLAGRSARIVVTMGMPAFVYRWVFGAHGLKSLERNVLRFCGIRPVRETLIGMVEGISDAHRQRWLETLRALGRAGK